MRLVTVPFIHIHGFLLLSVLHYLREVSFQPLTVAESEFLDISDWTFNHESF